MTCTGVPGVVVGTRLKKLNSSSYGLELLWYKNFTTLQL